LPNLFHFVRSLLSKPAAPVTGEPPRPQPTPAPTIPRITIERQRMQTPNQSTKSKYSGVIEHLLASANCLELSQITPEHLDRFLTYEGATGQQRSTLYALWNGQEQVSPELQSLLSDICYPRERERLLSYLREAPTSSPDVEDLLRSLAWK
jgi:hypothetical protein